MPGVDVFTSEKKTNDQVTTMIKSITGETILR